MIKIKLLHFFKKTNNTNCAIYKRTIAHLLLIAQVFFFLNSCGKYGKLRMPIDENLTKQEKQQDNELRQQALQEQKNYGDVNNCDIEFNF